MGLCIVECTIWNSAYVSFNPYAHTPVAVARWWSVKQRVPKLSRPAVTKNDSRGIAVRSGASQTQWKSGEAQTLGW